MGMMGDELAAGGVLSARVWRGDELVETREVRNTVTDAGLAILLDCAFLGAVPAGTWYLAPRGNGAQTPGDTWDSKAWAEVTTYQEAARPAWTPARSAPGLIESQTVARYSITGDETIIRGGTLISTAAKGQAGTLFMVASFGHALVLYPGDTLELHYALRLARA